MAYAAAGREWLRGEEGVVTESCSTFMGRAWLFAGCWAMRLPGVFGCGQPNFRTRPKPLDGRQSSKGLTLGV